MKLEKQRFKQKTLQVFIDYNSFILAVKDVQKQDLSIGFFEKLEDYQLDKETASKELGKYTDYYKTYYC